MPLDGSDNAVRAVQLVIRLKGKLTPLNVNLLYVREPWVPLGDEQPKQGFHEAVAEEALRPAKALPDGASVPYSAGVASGYVGSTIVAYATEHGCDAIVMGTRGMGSTGQVLGSIARQVVQLADVPVTLVK